MPKYNYKKMFLQQMESKKISSWGIRFYWNVFKQSGLVLFPDKSLVINNGWDSSGRHKDSYDIFPILDWKNDYRVTIFPNITLTDAKFNKIISQYIRKRTSSFIKVINRILLIFNKIH